MRKSISAWQFIPVFVLLILADPGLAQGPGERYSEAVGFFKAGRYHQAYNLFSSLPGSEPMVAYYSGACLAEMNRELGEAIEMLYGASRKAVPDDVNYYLGMAHHRNYNFKEALKYYGRFEIDASRQEVKTYRLKQKMKSCRTALELTASYNPYKVMAVAFLDMKDSVEYAQIRMRGGQLQTKAPEFSEGDEEGLEKLMFMPGNPLRGDYIYFASESRSGKQGTQLFRVKKGPGRSWGDPEEISALNTGGDELLPYYDPIESDLYFASDGRDGIGGFDLYRSHFDYERDEWSEPVNMGFPVNSVMDDYLLLPGSDLGMMMFFSNRQGTDSTLTVYRVHLVEPKKKTNSNDNIMLLSIANLGGAAADLLAELEGIPSEDDMRKSREADRAERTKPEITEVKILSEKEKELNLYQEILADALMHQARSDSLKDLAAAARIQVRESEDPNDRWVWQKQILVWEKKANDEEERADALFAGLDLGEEDSKIHAAVNPPEPLPEEFSTEIADQEDQNLFDILESSPYGRNNPIPFDITLPQGVFYRIQLGAFGHAVGPDNFGGISPLTADSVPEKGLIKYYAGKFNKYAKASEALTQLRNSGYEDAFIVSWYKGMYLSTQKAKQLE